MSRKYLFFSEEAKQRVLDVCPLSKDFVQPLIKRAQWYVDCDELAQRELDAVLKHKALTLLPHEAEQWLIEGGYIVADVAVYHKRLVNGLPEEGVLNDKKDVVVVCAASLILARLAEGYPAQIGEVCRCVPCPFPEHFQFVRCVVCSG